MFFLAHIIWGALAAFFPLYAVSQEVSNPGLFFGAYAIVLILGRGLGGRIIDLYSRESILLPCLASYVIGMTVLAFSKTLPMFIVVAVITGAGHAFLMPCLMAYAIDLAGDLPGAGDGHHHSHGRPRDGGRTNAHGDHSPACKLPDHVPERGPDQPHQLLLLLSPGEKGRGGGRATRCGRRSPQDSDHLHIFKILNRVASRSLHDAGKVF